MGLFHFLIVVQGFIAAALVGIILMQRSEGGGLGMGGGSPSGLMSARGAADFMTRTTTILATLFVLLSISLAFVAASEGGTSSVDETFQRTEAPAAVAPADPAAATSDAPVTAPVSDEVPLDQ